MTPAGSNATGAGVLTLLHVLVPEPPGERGGADLHVLDLALHQLAHGHRVAIAERGSPEFAGRARALGIPVVSASGLGRLAAVRQLGRTVKALRPDVVHAHGYDADYWAAATRIAGRRVARSCRFVFTQHGVVEDTLWHRAKTLADALSMRAADGVIVCADGAAGRMRRWCPGGLVRFVPNGVRHGEVPPRSTAVADLSGRFAVPAGVPLVGYVGRLSAEKRPDDVLRVVAAARAQGTRLHLLVVGAGGMRKELERLAGRLGIAGDVTFTGLVNDTATVYAALDAMLLLSDSEMTPRAVIEAMAAGVPVVATAVGGVPELLDGGRFGALVPPRDVVAATRALQAVLRQDGCRECARQWSRARYGIDTMGRRVEEFYVEVIRRGLRGRPARSAAPAAEPRR